jgi:hypothetical protein
MQVTLNEKIVSEFVFKISALPMAMPKLKRTRPQLLTLILLLTQQKKEQTAFAPWSRAKFNDSLTMRIRNGVEQDNDR